MKEKMEKEDSKKTRKIGNYSMKFKLLFLCITCLQCIQAQLQLDAEVSKKNLSIDETMYINYRIHTEGNANVDLNEVNFSLPEFEGFDILSTQNYNENMMVNGKMSQNYIVSFVLKPRLEGKMKIDAAQLSYKGKTIKSPSFSIQVTRNPSESNPPEKRDMKGGFLAFEVSNRNPYQSENFIGKLVFYASNPFYLQNIKNVENPDFKGFNFQIIENRVSNVYQKVVNGKTYYAKDLFQVILTPIKNGNLTIDPLEATVLVNDGYFGTRSQKIKSGKVKLNVRSLPSNSPKSFMGAVGNFKLAVEVPKHDIKANEPIAIDMKIEGNGNFTMVQLPPIKTPKEVESFKPKVTKNVRITREGEIGDIEGTNTLIAEKEGDFTIEIAPFSYFDPNEEKYIDIPARDIVLNVSESNSSAAISKTAKDIEENNSEVEEEYSANDETLESSEEPNAPSHKGNLGWWLIGTTAVLSLFAVFFWRNRKKKDEVISKEKPEAVAIADAPSDALPSASNIRYNFLPLKDAYLQNNRELFYKETEEMLKASKPRIEENTQMKKAYDLLSKKIQTQKYSPFPDVHEDKEIFIEAKEYYNQYFT